MKKIILLIVLFTGPLSASPSCIDKQGHSLACPCNCDAVRGRYCINCTHLQNAQKYTVITPTKMGKNSTEQSTEDISRDPQDVLNKLAVRYLQNK